MNRIDFIAEQLRGIAPSVKWDVQGIDRSIELAQMLDRVSVLNLWELHLIPVEYVKQIGAWTKETEGGSEEVAATEEVVKTYGFEYHGYHIGYLGTPTEPMNEPGFRAEERGYMLAWSAAGHGAVAYWVRGNPATKKLEIVPVWESSSEADFFRMVAITYISFFVFTALPLAGVSVGNAIGTAVLPATVSAAYPALATAVGNVALSAALSGGDIQGAVKNAVIGAAAGGVGAQVGGFAATMADSELIGSLASTATRAALTGQDIKTAVGIDLLKFGANMGSNGDAFDFYAGGVDFGDQNMFDTGFKTGVDDAYTFGVPDSNVFDNSFNSLYSDTSGNQDWMLPDVTSFNPFLESNGGLSTPIAGQPAIAPSAPPANILPPANSPAFSPSSVVSSISAAALAALQVVKAYRQLDTPAVNTTARVVRADGSVSAITSNGMIQTRSASGVVTSQRPPVGVAQSTIDGNVVVNNGDGTYTVISPTGQQATYSYSSGSATTAGGIPQAVWIGGGAVLLLLLMNRKG